MRHRFKAWVFDSSWGTDVLSPREENFAWPLSFPLLLEYLCHGLILSKSLDSLSHALVALCLGEPSKQREGRVLVYEREEAN